MDREGFSCQLDWDLGWQGSGSGCSGVMGMIVGGSWALCVGKDGGGIGWALGEEKKRKSKIGSKIQKSQIKFQKSRVNESGVINRKVCVV